MLTPLIGEKAGLLWELIQAKGEFNLTALKKQSKLDDKWLYLSLGWLAREGKLRFTQDKRQTMISLK